MTRPADAGGTVADLAIGDRVRFVHRNKKLFGHIASKGRHRAAVVGDCGREFQLHYRSMQKIQDGSPRYVQTALQRARDCLVVGDAVSFVFEEKKWRGTICAINARRASVTTQEGKLFRVPYARLEVSAAIEQRAAKLTAVLARARALMAEHGLSGWSFQLDQASRRGGLCRYGMKLISLSAGYIAAATDEQITDTILHEIAHALVGPGHHHDALWKQTARRIGCSAERCHTVDFTPPRYIRYCTGCGLSGGAQIRRRLFCRRCNLKLRYRLNHPSR